MSLGLPEPALLILVSLASGPKHGYAIILDVEALRGQAPAPSRARVELAPAAEPAPAVLPPRPLIRAQPGQWESLIDQIVREARERGAFDNLPGTGQPLPVDENPFAGEWELAFRL